MTLAPGDIDDLLKQDGLPMMADLDIPDFLRIPQAERREAWKGRKLTTARGDPKKDWTIPAGGLDATGRALLRQQQEEREARKRERLAALKERKKQP